MIGRELEFDIGEEVEESLHLDTLDSDLDAPCSYLKHTWPFTFTQIPHALSFIRGFSRTVTPYLGRRDSCAKKSAQIGEGVVLLRRKAFHEVLTDTHLLVSVVNFMKGLLIMQSYNAMRGCNQFSTPPTVDAIFKSECIARWHTAFVLVPSMI
jgi:hypothetical protein